MNTRLLFGLLCLTPTLCFGALSTDTSYFLNVEALTNVTARSAVRGLTGVLTNGLTAGASTFTGAVGFATGSAAAPGLFMGNDSNTGLFDAGSSILGIAGGGVEVMRISSGVLAMSSSGSTIGWSDTIIRRGGAANTLQGGTDAASPAAYTWKTANGTGSNAPGAASIHDGGYSTGTAAGGAMIFRTANSAGGTSSSLNTTSERFHAPAKWVTLTSATATTLFTIPVPATNYVGLTATVTIYATDGTDHQSKTSVITVDAIAKTTTITPTISQVDNTTAASAGTLTCTYTAVDNTSNVLAVKATADSSLTETVLRAKIVITAINASGTGAVTEQ